MGNFDSGTKDANVSFAARRFVLAAALAGGCVLQTAPVLARTATGAPAEIPATDASSAEPADQLKDIVVTAQRRDENVQKVPITISAFDGATLARSGIANVADLGTLVPGLVYNSVVGYATPFLRGIGTTATGSGKENPVAIYVDGVYYAAQAAGLMSLANIESIEVDKGPQGTLFGRNTTGGAIQIHTRTPSRDSSLYASVGYGNYNTATGQLYATGPIGGALAADVALGYSHQGDGFGTNLASGRPVDRTRAVIARSKLRYDSGDTRLTLAGDYSQTDGSPVLAPAPGTRPQFNPPIPSNPRDVYGSPEPLLDITDWGVSGTIEHDLGFAKLTSISAFRGNAYHTTFDSTFTAIPANTEFIDVYGKRRQFSQEIQLASTSQGPLSWVTGLYYFREHSGYFDPTVIGGGSIGLPSGIIDTYDRTTNAYAAFGQTTYKFTPETALTLGIRYTIERRFSRFIERLPDYGLTTTDFTGRLTFRKPTWRVALNHDFADGVMGYVSYNRGFKSGLFNNKSAVLPEQVDAFEAGVKTNSANHKIRLNAAGFYYDYRNIQETSYPLGQLVIINGAAATIYGLDVDADAVVTPELTLGASLEALHTRFDSFPNAPFSIPKAAGGTAFRAGGFDASGRELGNAPKFTASVHADYVTYVGSAKAALNVTYSYNGGWVAEADGRLRQPAYSLLNASVAIGRADDRITVKLWGKNLLDATYAVVLASQSEGDFVQYAAPRTFGVTVSTKF